MNGGLSKIRSLHTYVMHWMFYFERYCTKICLYTQEWVVPKVRCNRILTKKVLLKEPQPVKKPQRTVAISLSKQLVGWKKDVCLSCQFFLAVIAVIGRRLMTSKEGLRRPPKGRRGPAGLARPKPRPQTLQLESFLRLLYSLLSIETFRWKMFHNEAQESIFKKQPPDGAAVLPPSKLVHQSFRIRVSQPTSFDMVLGAKTMGSLQR